MQINRGGNQYQSITIDGVERHYIIHIPPSYDKSAAVPLVIMLHGAGHTALGALDSTGWTKVADEECFLVVFPDATRADPLLPPSFLRNPQVWNDGSGRAHTGSHNIDDTGFIRKLIDTLESKYVIDSSKIFIAGFSNGASMSYRLGVELSDKIAAIAPVSGHLWMKPQPLLHPVSLIAIAGVDDPINPLYGGEVETPWWGKEYKPSISDAVTRWAEMLTCGCEPSIQYYHSGIRKISYEECKDNAKVLFYIVDGLGHHWPGGKPLLNERIAGKQSNKVSATELIWQFFVTITGNRF